MRMCDIISKKRDAKELSTEEIQFFIDGYVSGEIPDYQMSALLMAIYFNGMTERETSDLTMCMAASGDMVDLSSISGVKVDKHSTGGVGDKTTLIISPIVAALGVKVAKMSGRGLGHTGGTIDKLEAIPGLRTDISRDEFFDIVNNVGVSVVGQSGNLVPADKKLYALRDVTGTIESMPLIASSVMSKKIAAGSDCIVLDVKVGSGAFMKTDEDAIELAKKMVSIGERVGRKTVALITDMDIPLGNAIGNSLEIMEVCSTLKGKGPEDLTDLCVMLAANMLYLAQKGDSIEACSEMVKKVIEDGRAFEKLKEMVEAQGGDVSVIEDSSNFSFAQVQHKIYARRGGFIFSMDTQKCGIASMVLGAGRETKESTIDYSAGIILHKKTGDKVKIGDCIATLHSKTMDKCILAQNIFEDAIVIKDVAPVKRPIVRVCVTKDGVQKIVK